MTLYTHTHHIHTGCTDMKRFMFISAGVLPERTSQHEWVDLKFLEKGVCYISYCQHVLDVQVQSS